MIDAALLAKIADRIDGHIDADPDPWAAATLDALAIAYGARSRFANGTHELKLAGVTVTSTSGGKNLIRTWQAKARRLVAEQVAR